MRLRLFEKIFLKSHGNISHIVKKLKESENQPSTSLKKLWGGGWWVHLDYSVSSAPFSVSYLSLWIWLKESFNFVEIFHWSDLIRSRSRSRAWQLQFACKYQEILCSCFTFYPIWMFVSTKQQFCLTDLFWLLNKTVKNYLLIWI